MIKLKDIVSLVGVIGSGIISFISSYNGELQLGLIAICAMGIYYILGELK